MAVHPLRPATYRRLGEPLPHQLANRTQSSPLAHIAFINPRCLGFIISGISCRFQQLSQTRGQVIYALLTRPPPSITEVTSSRLACVKHSVSVHPEPGSNSSFNIFKLFPVSHSFCHFFCLSSLFYFKCPAVSLSTFLWRVLNNTMTATYCQYFFIIFI